MSHLQLTVEYLFYTFNTIYFFLSIAIITRKCSCRIYNSKTILILEILSVTLISCLRSLYLFIHNLVITQL